MINMTNKISVVISAFNEEKNIKACLESIKWADEIIVVDNSSSDKTVVLAKKYTAKIYRRPNYQMLNINKNYGFEKAEGEWLLNLDADERVNDKLKEEIREVTKQPQKVVAFQMPRKNIIFGQWIKHGIWWPDYQIRLFKKGKAKFACKHVHEKLEVAGEVGQLKNPLIHHNYYSISQFVRKMNEIYTENEAENYLKAKKKIYWYDAIRMPVNDFIANFFARESYKDGLHGLVLSLLQAFYAFLVFAKLWERQKFWQYNQSDFNKEVYQEIKKTIPNFSYWIRKNTLKNFLKKILRTANL